MSDQLFLSYMLIALPFALQFFLKCSSALNHSCAQGPCTGLALNICKQAPFHLPWNVRDSSAAPRDMWLVHMFLAIKDEVTWDWSLSLSKMFQTEYLRFAGIWKQVNDPVKGSSSGATRKQCKAVLWKHWGITHISVLMVKKAGIMNLNWLGFNLG